MVENWVSAPGNLFPSKCGILRWDGFDEKIHWSPFLIWFCLGTMGEICGWLLRYGVTKQFVLACLKRAQDKRKRKRIIKRLKNKRSVKKCSDLKRCQKLLKPHVACAARKCSTHRLGKARLKHRRCCFEASDEMDICSNQWHGCFPVILFPLFGFSETRRMATWI